MLKYSFKLIRQHNCFNSNMKNYKKCGIVDTLRWSTFNKVHWILLTNFLLAENINIEKNICKKMISH